MQAVVSVKAIAVYGDCPEYPAGQISMKTFVKWAATTRTDLQSYPALNDKMRVLEQCITPEAKTALWACTTLTTKHRATRQQCLANMRRSYLCPWPAHVLASERLCSAVGLGRLGALGASQPDQDWRIGARNKADEAQDDDG